MGKAPRIKQPEEGATYECIQKKENSKVECTAQQPIYRCIACLILIVVHSISTITVYGWLNRLTGTSQQKPFITGLEGMTEYLEPGQRLTAK